MMRLTDWKKNTLLLLVPVLLAACSDSKASEPEASSQASEAASVGTSVDSSPVEAVSEEREVVYEYAVNPDIFTIEPLDSSGDPDVVLLTFDDSPQPPDSYTLAISETLQAKDANAIFFVMGQFLEDEEAQEIIRTVSEMGFEIGNHSYSHADFHTLTYEEQLEEITHTNDMVEAITGKRPRFLRAPYGLYNSDTLAICETEDMTMMNWSYGYDWEPDYMNGPALEEIMVHSEYLNSGSNLLMHDRPWTAQAIGGIIDGLRAKGYGIVDPTIIASPERRNGQ